MKIKSLLLTAFAASMTFVACDTDKDVQGEDNALKSVTINLTNVIDSRSASNPVAADSPVALNGFQVFFADEDGNLYKGQNAAASVATHYFASKTAFDDRTDQVFHFLPYAVDHVIVIGNITSEISATTEDELEKTLAIADEQDAENLYLYNSATLDKDGTDALGHLHYKAQIVLEPRVSRIEIGAFEYLAEGGNRTYKSIEIDQVMFNNYYPSASNIDGVVSGTKVAQSTAKGDVFNVLNDAANQSVWWTDVFSADNDLKMVTLDEDSEYKHTYVAGETPVLCPAYHFFPNTYDCPQLVLKLIGTLEDGAQEPLYLATNGFTPAVTTDMAKVYVVNFSFDDGDLGNPEKCVTVTVTVKNWTVVDVTPNF